MFLLLIAAAAIYIVLGDLREAIVLAASIVVVLLITILQERRTEHALARLQDLSSPRALVIRDGERARIPGREVVVGDIVLLREGDRVPADGVLRSATALSVDESILTGESLPVDKAGGWRRRRRSRVFGQSRRARLRRRGNHRDRRPQRDRQDRARTRDAFAGNDPALSRSSPHRTLGRDQSHSPCARSSRVFYALSRNDWLGGVLAGITVAMGVLPEEFPVVLTVFLAMGAWRISRAGVLTRRMPAVESIGAATVLAVDKTGHAHREPHAARAHRKRRRHAFDLRSGDASLDEHAASVLDAALAASERDAFDPMDRAIHEAAQRASPSARAAATRGGSRRASTTSLPNCWRSRMSGGVRIQTRTRSQSRARPRQCSISAASIESQRVALLDRVAEHAQQGLARAWRRTGDLD